MNNNIARAQSTGKKGRHRGVAYIKNTRDILTMVVMRLKLTLENHRMIDDFFDAATEEVCSPMIHVLVRSDSSVFTISGQEVDATEAPLCPVECEYEGLRPRCLRC